MLGTTSRPSRAYGLAMSARDRRPRRADGHGLATLVVLGLLAACGSGGPGSGYIDCAAGLPFAPVPPSDLRDLPSPTAVPSHWQPLNLGDVSLETPPPAAEPIYEDRENSANRRCISWNGDLFSMTVGREADELLLVAVTPRWQLDEAVGEASERFVRSPCPALRQRSLDCRSSSTTTAAVRRSMASSPRSSRWRCRPVHRSTRSAAASRPAPRVKVSPRVCGHRSRLADSPPHRRPIQLRWWLVVGR